MPPRRRQLQIRRTVLVVVEGDTEFAFCRHLKAIGSHQRNLQVPLTRHQLAGAWQNFERPFLSD